MFFMISDKVQAEGTLGLNLFYSELALMIGQKVNLIPVEKRSNNA